MQYVGAAVGAVIGFYAGGPSGAVYGAQIGYTIGAVVQTSNEKIVTEGPRLSDLRTTISQNGVFIPRVYVHAAGIGGNIIDATPLVPAEHTTETSAGKGGPTSVQKTTTYSATFRVLVCRSKGTHTLEWIKANGNLIWSQSPDLDPAALLAAANIASRITVYDGADDQLPDPFFEALRGVGNEPAYLDCLTVVCQDFQLANFSNNLEATVLTFGVVEKPPQPVERVLNTPFFSPLVGDDGVMWFMGGKASHGTGLDTGQIVNDQFVYRDLFDGSGPQRAGKFLTSDAPYKAGTILPDATFQPDSLPPTDGGPITEDGVFYETPPVYDLKAVSPMGLATGPVALVWLIGNTFSSLTHTVQNWYKNNYGHNHHRVVVTTYTVDLGPGVAQFYKPLGELVAKIDMSGKDGQKSLIDFRQENDNWLGVDQLIRNVRTRQLAASGGGWYCFVEKISNSSGAPYPDVNSFVVLKFEATQQKVTLTYPNQRVLALLMTSARAYVLVEHLLPGDPLDGSGYHYSAQVYKPNTNEDKPGITFVGLFIGPYVDRGGIAAVDMFEVGGLPTVVLNGRALWSWQADGTLSERDLSTIHDPRAQTLVYKNDDFFVFYDLGGTYGLPSTKLHSGSVSSEPQPLSHVIKKIAGEKVPFPNALLNCEQLPDSITCSGYVLTRQTSPRVAIDYLRDAYRVDAAESAGQIKLIARGGAPVRTWVADELAVVEITSGGDGGDQPDAVPALRSDEKKLPAQIQLKYTDRDNNYETGTVIIRRAQTDSQVVTGLDVSALMLTSTEAARFAQAAMDDAWLARDNFGPITTTYRHDDLESADVVLLPGKIKPRRARLRNKTDRGGMIEWTAVRDDPSALPQSQVVVGGGVPGSSAVGGSSSVFGGPVALVDILNLPALRAADDDAGFYAFVYSTSGSRFRGADVFDKSTTTPNLVASVAGGARVHGVARTVLPSAQVFGSFDLAASVDIEVDDPSASPVNASRLDLFAAKNIYLIGDELVGVRFVTVVSEATDTSPAVWRLHGGLLRGVRGTEAAADTHAAGERVYLLNATALVRDRTAADASGSPTVNVTIGAVSTGRSSTDLAKFSTVGTNTQRALDTVPPRNLTYGEDGAGGLIFRWTRRSRLPFKFGTPAPLGEDSESYEVDFGTDASFANGRTFYVASPQLAISAVDRAQLPTPILWRVKQIALGHGSGALTTATPTGTTTNGDVGNPMPADDLPHLLFKIDPALPYRVGPFDPAGFFTAFAVQDQESTLGPPSAIISAPIPMGGNFDLSPATGDKFLVYSGDYYTNIPPYTGTPQPDRFNLGHKDWTFTLNATIESRAYAPTKDNPAPVDGGALLNRAAYIDTPGLWHLNCPIINDGRGGQTADSGTITFFLPDFPTKILKSKPKMNDGRRHKIQVARRDQKIYLGIDGVIVDSADEIIGGMTDVPGFPLLTIGPFRGSMGVVSITTS